MITAALASFVAEAPVPPEVATVAEAYCAEPSTVDRHGDPVGFWVVCALLSHGADRSTLADATAVGLEVALRIRGSLHGKLAGGWDAYCPAVSIGVAAGVARLDGLAAPDVARALAVAATQAGGLAECVGTPLGEFQHQRAAENGRQAVVLARAGMTTPAAPLEGRRGLFPVMAPGADPSTVVDSLGRHWLLADHSTETGGGPTSDAVGYAREVLP